MAAGKTQQSNTSLVALVIFIVLFLICAVLATIFYTKLEDQKAIANNAVVTANKLAKPSEQSILDSKIVGPPLKGNMSYIKTMTEHLDIMVRTIIGELPEANAAAKVNDAKMKINETIANLGDDASSVFGEDGFDLLNTISDLKNKLDAARDNVADKDDSIAQLNDDIKLNARQYQEEKTRLIAGKDEAMEIERSVADKYNTLKALMEKTTDEQIQNWADKLEVADDKHKQQNIEIARITEELEDATFQLTEALAKIESFKSTPDNQVTALKTDAIVFTADSQNGLIYLNIGNEDHVYPGLTFSVFDRNAPIPKDGKGKAEIEVFRVNKSSCVAKILTSSKRDPVIKNDIAINMIWDSKTSNSFMVIGEFDFDGNGTPDRRGKEKIKQMILQWNGRIVKKLTIDTDFIVVGEEPEEMDKPTIQQIEDDPEIEDKYAKSVVIFSAYQQILDKAKVLSVPVFNRKRFMQLTGYETIAENSTPVDKN